MRRSDRAVLTMPHAVRAEINNFLLESARATIITTYVAVPLTYAIFVGSSLFGLRQFKSNVEEVIATERVVACADCSLTSTTPRRLQMRKKPPFDRADIAYSSLFIGAYTSNSLFALGYSWCVIRRLLRLPRDGC